jgi:hypothetical protein
MIELTTYATALQQTERCQYVEVHHFPEQQMAGVQPLRKINH